MVRRGFSLIVILAMAVICSCAATPEAEQEPFVFLFMSDTQADPETGSYSGFGALLETALSGGEPSLVILGGDVVNDPGDEGEWQDFLHAAGDMHGIAVAAAAGNHDDARRLAELFDWPASAPAARRQGCFYSFDMRGVHFTVMDSNIMGAARDEDAEWLEADLSGAAGADWRVAVCHHPFWPVSDNHKDNARAEAMRERFLPLLAGHNVDLLLVGHQNVYSRCEPETGPVQVMAASGGKASYGASSRPYIAATAGAPNYVLVSADGDALTITAFDGAGAAFDAFVVDRDLN